METLTYEFDGRCPECGSEELVGDMDTYFECECGHAFRVIIDLDDALFY